MWKIQEEETINLTTQRVKKWTFRDKRKPLRKKELGCGESILKKLKNIGQITWIQQILLKVFGFQLSFSNILQKDILEKKLKEHKKDKRKSKDNFKEKDRERKNRDIKNFKGKNIKKIMPNKVQLMNNSKASINLISQ